MIVCSRRVRKNARTQRRSSVAKRSRACMARGILHDAPDQHESDSRIRFGVSSVLGRVEAGRRKAQQFRSGPILRTRRSGRCESTRDCRSLCAVPGFVEGDIRISLP